MQKINYTNLLDWHQVMELEEVYYVSSPQPKKILYAETVEKTIIEPRVQLVQNKVSQESLMAKKTLIKQDFSTNSAVITARELANKCITLEELKTALLDFNGCALKLGAKNTVFADGISTANIMLIGEAPGATEDEQGRPFCGESGKLLDNMLNTIGLKRNENFYITNTVFYRPPANRQPTIEEIEICRPFVEKHIAIVQPKLLILVGSTAVSSLLGPHLQISKIRREYYQYTNQYLTEDITTTAIFHPAYLLRQPLQKKTTWYDLIKIKEFIEINYKK